MESLEDSTAPCIQAEVDDLQVKDYDDSDSDYDDWIFEMVADEESIKSDNPKENDIYLFLSLFESSIGTLQQKVKDLREVADSLERMHYRTTMGSLTGGVVSAVAGVASVVGLALAPATFGASLAVTQVGVVTALAGGLTSGVSSITKKVNESMDRKSIEQIIKDFQSCMKPISECLRKSNNNITIIRSTNKRIAAKAHKAGQVAGVLTGAFPDLFVALDLYFIAQDTKIQNINRANKESAAVKLIAEVRETAKQFEDGLDELREIAKALREEGLHELREISEEFCDGGTN